MISNSRWAIGLSIALELDTALAAAHGYYAASGLPPALAALVAAIPADWQSAAGDFLEERGRQTDLLETLATLAGVLLEPDYARATLAMRELTVEEAVARLAGEDRAPSPPARPLGTSAAGEASAEPGGMPAVQLASLIGRHQETLYREAGFDAAAAASQGRRLADEALRTTRILRGGDLHARFWHWLDRFYYETYQPWRSLQAEALAAAEQRGQLLLPGADAASSPAPGDLPPQSPLLRYPELRSAVQNQGLAVFLWVEPFGLADTWALYRPAGSQAPPVLLLSFAPPGEIYENFRAAAASLAQRAAALGDPTRLVILRLIRNFGMINTEIAEFLGLARPTVSIHAKILRDAGLIHSRQQGREMRHEIAAGEVERLFRDLARFLDIQ